MIRRAWLLLSWSWAIFILFILSGKPDTKLDTMLWVAAFPFIAGFLLHRGVRYVITGSFRLPRVIELDPRTGQPVRKGFREWFRLAVVRLSRREPPPWL